MKNLLLIAAIFYYVPIFGQNIESLNKEFKDFNTKETKTYGFFERNLMCDLKINLLGELFSPRAMNIQILDKSFSDYDTIRFKDRNLLINLIGIGLEPRISLYSNEEFTVGLKAGFHLNFSLYTNFDSSYKNAGTFHFNSSGMLYFAKGLSSSFSNTQESGFAVSGGMLFLKAPLLGGKSSYLDVLDSKELLPESEEFLVDSWLLPAVQFDYYFLTQEFKMRNFSLAFSHFKENTYFRFNYGFTF